MLGDIYTGFSAHLAWSPTGDRILFNTLNEQGIAEGLMELSITERSIFQANAQVWGFVDALNRLRNGSGFMIAGPRNPGPTNLQEPSELWLLPTMASDAIRLTFDPFDYAANGSDQQGDRLTFLQRQFGHTVKVIVLANPTQPRQVMHMSRAGRWWLPVEWTHDNKILYPALAGHDVYLGEVDSNGQNRRRITTSGTFNSSCSVSPDGQRVVYNSFTARQARIRKTSPADGQTVDIDQHLDYMPSFSADGLKISCLVLDTLTYEYKLSIVSGDDGRVLQTFDQKPESYASTRWTPDGQGIVYVQRSGNAGNLWLQSLAGGEPRQLTYLTSGSMAGFDLSTHGDSVAVATMEEVSDVVMFEDYQGQIARALGQERQD